MTYLSISSPFACSPSQPVEQCRQRVVLLPKNSIGGLPVGIPLQRIAHAAFQAAERVEDARESVEQRIDCSCCMGASKSWPVAVAASSGIFCSMNAMRCSAVSIDQ